MTRVEETALAQVLAICADSGLKLATVFRLGKALTLGASRPKTTNLKNALRLYQKAFPALTKERIEEVLAARQQGIRVVEIARSTGLTLNVVYYILQGKYPGAPEGGHNFPSTGEKRGRPKGSKRQRAI